MKQKTNQGRRRLYDLSGMKVGDRITLTDKARLYPYAYAQSFNRRGKEKFKAYNEGEEFYLERIL